MKTVLSVYKLDDLTEQFLKRNEVKVDAVVDGAGLESTRKIVENHGVDYIGFGKRISTSEGTNAAYRYAFNSDTSVFMVQNDTATYRGFERFKRIVDSTDYGIYFGTQYGFKRKSISLHVPRFVAQLAIHIRGYGFVESSWFSSYALKKWVYEKCGGLDESYGISGFATDDDYMMTLIQNDVGACQVKGFEFWHRKSSTFDLLPEERELYLKDKEACILRFKQKWARDPFNKQRLFPNSLVQL